MTRKNDIKFFISKVLVEISRSSIRNFSLNKDFKEIIVFILSISILLFLFFNLGPNVFACK